MPNLQHRSAGSFAAPERTGPRPALSFAALTLRETGRNLLTWTETLLSWRKLRMRARRPAWTRPGRLLLGGLLAVAAVMGAMLLLDGAAIRYQRSLPEWLIEIFETITDFGRSGSILIPTAVLVVMIAVVVSGRMNHVSRLVLVSLATRFGFVFCAVALPGLLVTVVKRLIGRARPFMWESSGVFLFSPFSWKVEYASLPSGHGTTAFATAFAIASLYPRWRVALWAFAALIALSRVVVAAHYPSDVIAGAVVGVFGALVVRNWFASRGLAFAVAEDRSVHALPGPSWRRVKAALWRGGAPTGAALR